MSFRESLAIERFLLQREYEAKQTCDRVCYQGILNVTASTSKGKKAGRSPERCETKYVALLSLQIILIDSLLATTRQVALYWRKGRKYTQWEIWESSIFSQKKTTNAINFPRAMPTDTRGERSNSISSFRVCIFAVCFLEILFFLTRRAQSNVHISYYTARNCLAFGEHTTHIAYCE